MAEMFSFDSDDSPVNNTCYETPLAERMRPRSLDDYFGQSHLLGANKPLNLMLGDGKIPSCIFYGPPGVGKTTLARLLASVTKRKLLEINAVSAKIATLRELLDVALLSKKQQNGLSAIAFVDEIYHFNSQQQNVLLPWVEKGDLILVGTTTENPWFEINKTLLSRMIVFTLESIQEKEMVLLLKNALQDRERGLGKLDLETSDEVMAKIAALSGGDARQALSRLEVVAHVVAVRGGSVITNSDVYEATGSATQRYDRSGDDHFALISALIKSIRGSDPDAAIYWLARMLSSGDDVRFITRRLCILASEDIGLADSMALVLAQNASAACERVGLPEAQIILSHLVIYLSAAPKSNSAYLAIKEALSGVHAGDIMPVQGHLKNVEGSGYEYPHDAKGHWVPQAYLPEYRHYYRPCDTGNEPKIRERLKRFWKRYHE